MYPLCAMPVNVSAALKFTFCLLSCVFAKDLNFPHVYKLHQKNGFTCMLLGEIFELVYVFYTSFIVLREFKICLWDGV